MSGRSSKLSYIAAALLVAVVSLSVRATPLPPGGTVAPGIQGLGGGATPASALISSPFVSVPPSFSGTLNSQAFSNDANNPFGLGALTFVYQLFNNGNSQDALQRFVGNNFLTYGVDVAISGAGTAPVTADRNASGDNVAFDWSGGPGIIPGASSTLLLVRTSATQTDPMNAAILDGGGASAASIGPKIVPEPASLGSLLLVGAGLVARRRR